MEKANISWFVKETNIDSSTYSACTDYYAGSCSSNEDLSIDIRVWNNRWGQEDVEDIENAKLILSFSEAEDNILLNLCEFSLNGSDFEEIDKSEFDRGIINLGSLSGKHNTGTDNNTSNYKTIIIKFTNIPTNIQTGLKSMFLDVEYNQ